MPLNPKLPDKLDSGPGFLKRVVNSIRAFAIENRITTVTVREKVGTEQVSGQLKPFANGSGVNLELIVGGAGGTSMFPFQLIDASNMDDGLQVRVRYATVFDLDIDWEPAGMVPGDDPPLILPVSGLPGYVWLAIVTDSTTLDVLSVTPDTGTSIPTSDDTHSYKELGSYSDNGADGLTVVNTVRTSLGYLNSNGDHVYWET